MKDIFDKVSGTLTDLKGKARKLKKEADQKKETVKAAVQTGVETSKAAVKQGKAIVDKVADRQKIKKGLEVTQKGADLVAKGAKGVASTMEKTSEKISDLKKKI